MELTGKQVIQLPRAQVWEALNDPQVLKQCIPGCDQFTASGENEYDIVMTAAVGPIKAKFKGKLTLSDINPPESYTLTFDGSGGAAGFGKGNASVSLGDLPGQTELAYAVQAKVGGRLPRLRMPRLQTARPTPRKRPRPQGRQVVRARPASRRQCSSAGFGMPLRH